MVVKQLMVSRKRIDCVAFLLVKQYLCKGDKDLNPNIVGQKLER